MDQTDIFAKLLIGVCTKRKHDDSTPEPRQWGNPPKKMKVLEISQYIYETLFKEQQDYDVKVTALDNVWHLHKWYLCQSPYFFTIFGGFWKEGQQSFVHVEILDDRITIDSLDAVFGSLYCSEIEIDASRCIATLATATLFCLKPIIQKSAEKMLDTINPEMAMEYYDASCQYGELTVKLATFEWLQVNLLSIYNKNQKLLRKISIELMTALADSPDLYVMQTEFSLYILLRTWMYLRLHPEYDTEAPRERLVVAGVQTHLVHRILAEWLHFENRGAEERSFLATREGQPYVETFRKLRTQHMINFYTDTRIIDNDNIIPKEWYCKHFTIQSYYNRASADNIDQAEFDRSSMRCGRFLLQPGYQKWRWIGYHFSLDLVISLDSRHLRISRHQRLEHERLLTPQTERPIMIRVAVTSIDAQRQPIFTQTTEIQTLTLTNDDKVELMYLDSNLVHPLAISVNMLLVPAPERSYKAVAAASDEPCSTAAMTNAEIVADGEGLPTPQSSDDSFVSFDD